MYKLAILSAVLASTFFPLHGEEKLQAFVTKVEDGDTLRLSVTGSAETVRCRLAGIDAPEPGQSFAEVSRARLSELLEKTSVLFVDVGPDKYKRRLGRVYLADGTDVNLQMVREGYAWHLGHFLTNVTFSAAMKEAQTARRGLWIEERPIEPRIFRKDRAKAKRSAK